MLDISRAQGRLMLQRHLARERVAGRLVQVHEVARQGGARVDGGAVRDAEGGQLAPQRRQPRGKLRHVGAVQAVDAVGAQDALLHDLRWMSCFAV